MRKTWLFTGLWILFLEDRKTLLLRGCQGSSEALMSIGATRTDSKTDLQVTAPDRGMATAQRLDALATAVGADVASPLQPNYMVN